MMGLIAKLQVQVSGKLLQGSMGRSVPGADIQGILAAAPKM
jgi:hypothetical protein